MEIIESVPFAPPVDTSLDSISEISLGAEPLPSKYKTFPRLAGEKVTEHHEVGAACMNRCFFAFTVQNT